MGQGAHWVPIPQACQRLGLSSDIIERLIADGDIPSKVEDGHSLVAVPIVVFVPGPQADGTFLDRDGSSSHTWPPSHEPPVPSAPLQPDWREREAELKSEITFLRALVEGHLKSEAELRENLREALKAVPKQYPFPQSPEAQAIYLEAYAPLRSER